MSGDTSPPQNITARSFYGESPPKRSRLHDAGEEPKNLDRDSPIPLKNLGNTCYENSIIQCLFSLNMFMDSFERSMKQFVGDDVRFRISKAFENLYQSYTEKRANLTPIALVSSTTTSNERAEIETRLEELKSAVGERSSQFNSTHQQDASEFFYHVIDSIQEFYQSLQKTNDDDNPVTKAFELELDYLIRCPKCHHKTMSEPEKIRTLPLALPHVNNENNQNVDEFNNETNTIPTPPTSDLGLDSPKSNDSSEDQRNVSEEKETKALINGTTSEERSSTSTSPMHIAELDLTDKSEHNNKSETPIQGKHYTLCDALDNYFKDDLLEYSCSQPECDSQQRTRKCLIRKLPQVLFITLARYSYTGKKSLDEIEAPFEISVPFHENKSPSHSPSAHRDFHDDDNKYQLVAVVCHLGPSLNAGHYTSYVYNQNNFSWYSCDDDSITRVQESEVKTDASKSGYCFFYAHKSCVAQKKDSMDQKVMVDSQSLRHIKESEAMVVTSSVADSSVIMTPESSPKSSPNPSTSITQNGYEADDGRLFSPIPPNEDDSIKSLSTEALRHLPPSENQ